MGANSAILPSIPNTSILPSIPNTSILPSRPTTTTLPSGHSSDIQGGTSVIAPSQSSSVSEASPCASANCHQGEKIYLAFNSELKRSGGHFAKYWAGGGGGEIFKMYAFGVRLRYANLSYYIRVFLSYIGVFLVSLAPKQRKL